ncbi:hypothetical protein BJ508DRAFT_367314 [Ascobolus immersus RN42]|uniref:Uncharacterized protein n=1 Tax=Ascobolus immersus RN42 TaxID=1160509 RepID=A0A3N4HDH1_ASCIM|nr:hypothetical protein BJ508DRAFT_367314 [Ascobolus immersus RN42]
MNQYFWKVLRPTKILEFFKFRSHSQTDSNPEQMQRRGPQDAPILPRSEHQLLEGTNAGESPTVVGSGRPSGTEAFRTNFAEERMEAREESTPTTNQPTQHHLRSSRSRGRAPRPRSTSSPGQSTTSFETAEQQHPNRPEELVGGGTERETHVIPKVVVLQNTERARSTSAPRSPQPGLRSNPSSPHQSGTGTPGGSPRLYDLAVLDNWDVDTDSGKEQDGVARSASKRRLRDVICRGRRSRATSQQSSPQASAAGSPLSSPPIGIPVSANSAARSYQSSPNRSNPGSRVSSPPLVSGAPVPDLARVLHQVPLERLGSGARRSRARSISNSIRSSSLSGSLSRRTQKSLNSPLAPAPVVSPQQSEEEEPPTSRGRARDRVEAHGYPDSRDQRVGNRPSGPTHSNPPRNIDGPARHHVGRVRSFSVGATPSRITIAGVRSPQTYKEELVLHSQPMIDRVLPPERSTSTSRAKSSLQQYTSNRQRQESSAGGTNFLGGSLSRGSSRRGRKERSGGDTDTLEPQDLRQEGALALADPASQARKYYRDLCAEGNPYDALSFAVKASDVGLSRT